MPFAGTIAASLIAAMGATANHVAQPAMLRQPLQHGQVQRGDRRSSHAASHAHMRRRRGAQRHRVKNEHLHLELHRGFRLQSQQRGG